MHVLVQLILWAKWLIATGDGWWFWHFDQTFYVLNSCIEATKRRISYFHSISMGYVQATSENVVCLVETRYFSNESDNFTKENTNFDEFISEFSQKFSINIKFYVQNQENNSESLLFFQSKKWKHSLNVIHIAQLSVGWCSMFVSVTLAQRMK